MLLSASAWDLSVLNSGLLGAILGVVAAVVISAWITFYSLGRSERADRTVAFETSMLTSAEELSAALVDLRYKLDPLFTDNWEHRLDLAPADVVSWTRVARAHASALAVEGREYREAAERLSTELVLFTAAVQSAAGRDADTREGAYGWDFQRSDSYDSVLQAADQTMADWADALLDGLADLRRGHAPRFQRPKKLQLKTEAGETIDNVAGFENRRWYPQEHLIWDATELAEDEFIS